MTNMTDLHSTAEVASRLGCSKEKIWVLVRQDKLRPAIKGPGRSGAFFFTSEEIQNYIDSQA